MKLLSLMGLASAAMLANSGYSSLLPKEYNDHFLKSIQKSSFTNYYSPNSQFISSNLLPQYDFPKKKIPKIPFSKPTQYLDYDPEEIEYLKGNSKNEVKGNWNRVKGNDNALIGNYNHLFGINNAILGSSNKVYGSSNGLLGNQNLVLGNYNGVIGTRNEILGNCNGIFGNQNQVVGHANLINGNQNKVTGVGNTVDSDCDASLKAKLNNPK